MTQLLPRFHRRELERANAAVDKAVREAADPTPQTVARATLPGDTRRLRGIPCVALGVSGTAPGTDPLGAMIRRER